MGAYNDILNQNNNNPPEDNNGGKGTYQMYGNAQNPPSEQNNDNADTDIISTAQGQGIAVKPVNQPQKTEVSKINPQVTTTQTPAQSISLLELYKRLNPRPDTNKKEEEKKQRRAQLAAAIGDGISALSNLFFTYKGAPNSYTGENNITAQNKVTYDKLKKERDEKYAQYLNGYMRAFQADQANADKERAWKRQLERDKKADEDSQRNYDFRVNQAAQNQKNFEAQLKQQKEIVDANNKARKEAAEKNAETQRSRLRGRQLTFENRGNKVTIWEGAWKASMQQVFKAIVDDLTPDKMDTKATSSWKSIVRKANQSAQDREDFVKLYWADSPKARELMLELSKTDPADPSYIQQDDEDYSQYEVNTDDDFSQYEVKQ